MDEEMRTRFMKIILSSCTPASLRTSTALIAEPPVAAATASVLFVKLDLLGI